MTPDLRLIRYFVAVADAGTITRAAEDLHISQPSLSAAIKELERRLGVDLLERRGRRVVITPAGAVLRDRGRALLEQADGVVAEVRDLARAETGRLRLGVSPTARYGVGPALLAACAVRAPAAMLYTTEDTTGAMLRAVARGDLDLAITFCAPDELPAGVEVRLLREEPAVVHLPAGHALARRRSVRIADLADETLLVAASRDSGGFTQRILAAFSAAGVTVRTLEDPYPDLGLQAVREGLGVVVYARSAFPDPLEGSVFVPLRPSLPLPFHLASRRGDAAGATAAVLAVAATL